MISSALHDFENNFKAFMRTSMKSVDMDLFSLDGFTLAKGQVSRRMSDLTYADKSMGFPFSRASDPTIVETSDEDTSQSKTTNSNFETPVPMKGKAAALTTQTSVENPFSPARPEECVQEAIETNEVSEF